MEYDYRKGGGGQSRSQSSSSGYDAARYNRLQSNNSSSSLYPRIAQPFGPSVNRPPPPPTIATPSSSSCRFFVFFFLLLPLPFPFLFCCCCFQQVFFWRCRRCRGFVKSVGRKGRRKRRDVHQVNITMRTVCHGRL
jgi:hypothetical protein